MAFCLVNALLEWLAQVLTKLVWVNAVIPELKNPKKECNLGNASLINVSKRPLTTEVINKDLAGEIRCLSFKL